VEVPTLAQKKVQLTCSNYIVAYLVYNKHLLKYALPSCCSGKELNDPRVLTDVGDVPIQEIRDCGVEDDRLMNVVSESVKTVMEEVSTLSHHACFKNLFVDHLSYFLDSS
jgi:hypothetical protein